MSARMSARYFSTNYAKSNVNVECRTDNFRRFNVTSEVTRMSTRSFSTIQCDVGSDNLLLSFSLTEPAIQVDQRERQKNCQTKRNLISENLIQTKLSQNCETELYLENVKNILNSMKSPLKLTNVLHELLTILEGF
jgi:hypothetical protein